MTFVQTKMQKQAIFFFEVQINTANKLTQHVAQLQHSRTASTRIAPLAFIPLQNAEVDHVTVE